MPDDKKIEVKSVKHVFTDEETNQLNLAFRRAYEDLNTINAEFDSVRATYKSKISEKESRMATLSATLNAGFEHRNERCFVVFVPAKRQKLFYLETDSLGNEPAIVENMTPEDFQAELFQAESKFENKTEIELFPPAAGDRGVLVLGQLKNRWFSALRVSVGAHKIDQRLDSEQVTTKTRAAAIDRSALEYKDWLKKVLGKDNSKGFEEPLKKALEGEAEKAE